MSPFGISFQTHQHMIGITAHTVRASTPFNSHGFRSFRNFSALVSLTNICMTAHGFSFAVMCSYGLCFTSKMCYLVLTGGNDDLPSISDSQHALVEHLICTKPLPSRWASTTWRIPSDDLTAWASYLVSSFQLTYASSWTVHCRWTFYCTYSPLLDCWHEVSHTTHA